MSVIYIYLVQGLLLILVRKPYDIGDVISIANVGDVANPEGSPGWIVEKVDLYSTTLRYTATREVATVTNGSLSNMQIINKKRSQCPQLYIFLKFGVDTPLHKIEEFRRLVTEFVKDRPREWLCLIGFRSTRIEADLGYIEYVIVLQHRESWQSLGLLLQSKADLSSFCLELQKKLGMKYIAPPLPVNLSMSKPSAESPMNASDVVQSPEYTSDLRSLAERLEDKKTK